MLKRLLRIAAVLAATTAIGLWAARGSSCPLPEETLDTIRDWVEQDIAADACPGLVLGVRCGNSIWIEAFGVSDMDTQAPLESSHQFLIGSIAKQFVAVGIMRLVEEGRLSLDDRIGDYIDNLKPSWSGITIRHCLNHTSGIASFGVFGGLPANTATTNVTRADIIGYITAGDLFYPPGEDHIYSTAAYDVLAYIVELVTGAPIDTFITREFLEPLGMHDTGFLMNRSPASLAGYHQHYWKGQVFFRDPPTTSWGFADGMFATVSDLLTWQAALSSGQVIREASYASMIVRTTTRAGGVTRTHDYGLGLQVFADATGAISEVGHWGNGGGHIAYVWGYPEQDIGVVALQCSTGNGLLAPLLQEIGDLLRGLEAGGT